jgi:excinuclease UvrABC nuclease subunit
VSKPSSADWLSANRFEEYGAWLGPKKLQRVLKIGRRVPGVYAFLVKGKIVYLGKATHLRGRVRNYNRFLFTDEARPHRAVHIGLLTALSEAGASVQVYVCRTTTAEQARECEQRWIKEIDPDWNRADRLLRRVAERDTDAT